MDLTDIRTDDRGPQPSREKARIADLAIAEMRLLSQFPPLGKSKEADRPKDGHQFRE